MARTRTDEESLIVEAAAKGITPEKDLKVSEWADAFRFLSAVSSPEPGQWRTSRVPFMREIMDALSPGSEYEFVDFMKGSQIAGTEAGLNFTGTVIDIAPGPMLQLMPTETFAKDYSRTRLDPMITESPALRGKVVEARSREGGNTVLMKEFHGGFISLVGANATAGLRGKPIRYLFADEVDIYPGDIGGEGDPLELAIVRTRNFAGRRKVFITSTPTIAGRSRIERRIKDTDRRMYFVPCPHCEHMQTLRWAQVRWEKNKPQTAHYVCEVCNERIYDYQKTEMLAGGEWRAMDPGNASRGRVGFVLSSLYSPVGWLSWESCVEQFLRSKDDRELLKVFINTILGETFEERGDAPEWELLAARTEDYAQGTVPAGGLFLTAGVDVQKDRVECEVVAWGRGKESWSVDYRVFPGGPETEAPWARLDDMLGEYFPTETGGQLNISMLAIDSGYSTAKVYEWARRYPMARVIVIKGTSINQLIGQPRTAEVTRGGRRMRAGVKVWPVGVGVAKMELYGWLRLPRPLSEKPYPSGFVHFPQYPDDWFRQLTAEHLQEVRQRGGVRYEWTLIPGRRNEALDCRVYARAAAAVLGVDRFTEERWSRLEQAIPPAKRPADGRKERTPERPPAQKAGIIAPKPPRKGVISDGFR